VQFRQDDHATFCADLDKCARHALEGGLRGYHTYLYRPPGFAALANGREISTVFAPGKAAAGKYVHITRICGKYA
jgi:hypothetical protein